MISNAVEHGVYFTTYSSYSKLYSNHSEIIPVFTFARVACSLSIVGVACPVFFFLYLFQCN